MARQLTDDQRAILDSILTKYESNSNDFGRFGRCADVLVRMYLTGKVERCHPLGISDTFLKRIGAIETKTGCGWLLNPEYATPEDALAAWASKKNPIPKARYIAYNPTFTDFDGLTEFIVLTQTQFINALNKYNLVRVKAHSGKYGIAIQSYIPTPTFKASKQRYNDFMATLENNGLYLDCFADKKLIDVTDW